MLCCYHSRPFNKKGFSVRRLIRFHTMRRDECLGTDSHLTTCEFNFAALFLDKMAILLYNMLYRLLIANKTFLIFFWILDYAKACTVKAVL